MERFSRQVFERCSLSAEQDGSEERMALEVRGSSVTVRDSTNSNLPVLVAFLFLQQIV